MIKYKTTEEIAIMKKSGEILKKVMKELVPYVVPGVSTLDIDNKAKELIIKNNGEVSFDKVKDYFWATCLPINEEIVHAIPSKSRILKNGDVLTIDIGVLYKGFHTDHAITFVVGESKDKEIEKFLEVGKKTLQKALKKVKIGNHIGDISKVIYDEIRGAGYFTLRELTGHGVGKDLHEDPNIFGYVNKPIEKTALIKNGMVLAVEVIYSFSCEHIDYVKENDWTLVTQDGSISACFEHTIAVDKNKSFILT